MHGNQSSQNAAGDVDDSKCSFRQPCTEYKYKYLVTESPWPHESSQLSFYCKFIKDCNLDNVTESNHNNFFQDYFDIYGEINARMKNDSKEAMKMLKERSLISSNFIQLKVKYPVSVLEISDLVIFGGL